MANIEKEINETGVLRGLDGVVAAETGISFVDGENGELYYRGYSIHEIAEHSKYYTEIVYLLLWGELPNKSQLKKFRRKLISEMRVPTQIIRMIEILPFSSPPMSVLRTAVSALACFDPDAEDNSLEACEHKAIRLIAQIPTIVATLYRIRNNLSILSPDPKLSLSANILYMFNGKRPHKRFVRAMNLLLLLHADHGLNASTFAARVTVSTLSDIHSAVTSAIGTLKGPLHGGANERVMKMLKEITEIHEVEAYIDSMLAQSQKVMGFGHRVYKKEDPRARHLREMSEELCSLRGNKKLYEISHRIENIVLEKKGIYPNVDFYSATVQHALGIPEEFFTAMFAVSRISGWAAHILEQKENNRLIRPTSRYMGQYGRKFVPLDERE